MIVTLRMFDRGFAVSLEAGFRNLQGLPYQLERTDQLPRRPDHPDR